MAPEPCHPTRLPLSLLPLQMLLGGSPIIAAARWHLAKAIQRGGAARVSPALRSLLRLGGSAAQQQLPAQVGLPMRLAAVFACGFLSCKLLGLPGLAHHLLRLAGGEREEVLTAAAAPP